MKTASLKFRNMRIELACDDIDRVQHLAEILDKNAAQMEAGRSNNVSEFKMLYIIALTLQDEVLKLQGRVASEDNNLKQQQDNSDEQLSNSVCETMEYVAEYLETLASAINKKYP